MWFVQYDGFLQTVYREFKTKKRAKQWLRQVGRYGVSYGKPAKIGKVGGKFSLVFS